MGLKPFKERTKLIGATAAEKNMYDNGARLIIEHVPTGYTVSFAAFIENFSDAYNSEWAAEQVYGRMDPIATFMHTRRAVAVSWKIPAASISQARSNLDEVSKLISFLYPLYAEKSASTSINMAPLVRVKFGNLIHNANTGGGLLGYLNGFTTDIDTTESGMFAVGVGGWTECQAEYEKDDPAMGTGANQTCIDHLGTDLEFYPRNIILNFEMNVLHEHPLGWAMGEGGKAAFRAGSAGFPYGPSRNGPPSPGNEHRPRAQNSKSNDAKKPVPNAVTENEDGKVLNNGD